MYFLPIAAFLGLTTAQILTTGNSQLPACALGCAKLNQAVQACPGGQTQSDQTVWNCFCQSGYLIPLRTTAVGTCDTECPDATSQQQIMSWYVGNCGQDFGASEHAGQAVVTTTAAAEATAATTTTAGTVVQTGSSTAATGDHSSADGQEALQGSWWSNHYKWIIMLLVIIVGIALLTWLLVFLRRRHERKRDALPPSFNAGITTRTAPSMPSPHPVTMVGSGRDSPVRTRDAFMPYGYGYSRSESRLDGNTTETQFTKSPLAHDGTTLAELEKGLDTTPTTKKKRVYVRERSMTDFEKKF